MSLLKIRIFVSEFLINDSTNYGLFFRWYFYVVVEKEVTGKMNTNLNSKREKDRKCKNDDAIFSPEHLNRVASLSLEPQSVTCAGSQDESAMQTKQESDSMFTSGFCSRLMKSTGAKATETTSPLSVDLRDAKSQSIASFNSSLVTFDRKSTDPFAYKKITTVISSETAQVYDVVNFIKDSNDNSECQDEQQRLGDEDAQVLYPTVSAKTTLDEITTRIENDKKDQWSCPRCTLINSWTQLQCQVCHYYNTENSKNSIGRCTRTQSPDLAVREILKQRQMDENGLNYAEDRFELENKTYDSMVTDVHPSNNANDNTGTAIPSEDVMSGGMFGRESASFRRNRVQQSVREEFNEGAVPETVWGALHSEIIPEIQPSNSDSNLDSTRHIFLEATTPSNAANTVNVPEGAHMSQRSRATHSRYATSQSQTNTTASNDDALLINLILQQDQRIAFHNYHRHHPLNQINVDQLSYDQLLELFGDGSDKNCGMSGDIIQTLPSKKIKNVKTEIHEKNRSCSICLDEFKNGERIRTLPCWHVFHEHCVDRWLNDNASCPVCKLSFHGMK